MSEDKLDSGGERRTFLKAAGAGLTAAGAVLSTARTSAARALSDKDKLARIASNSYPMRSLFKRRPGRRGPSQQAQAFA